MGCTYYISISSINANLSPSIAMSFVSMTMFNVAILFYFLYGELLTKKVFIGMFLVLISMIIISLEKAHEHSNTTSNPDSKDDIGVFTKLLPVMFAIIMSFFNAINTFFMRYLGRRGYSPIRISVDYLYIYSFFSMTIFFYETFFGEPYTWS